jgi:hypothetical protein
MSSEINTSIIVQRKHSGMVLMVLRSNGMLLSHLKKNWDAIPPHPAPPQALPLTEMNSRSRKIVFLGVKRRQCLGLTTLPPSMSQCLNHVGSLTFPNPIGLKWPAMGIALLSGAAYKT